MKKKNLFIGALALTLSFALLTGCGKKNKNQNDDKTTTSEISNTSGKSNTSSNTEGVKDNYKVTYIDPQTGENKELTAIGGVVSGLPTYTDSFTLEDNLFVTKYEFTGFYSIDGKVENGDVIDSDITLYPHQEILARDLNDKTIEKEDVTSRIDEIIDYFEDEYIPSKVVYATNETGVLKDVLYANADGTYRASKYNQFVKTFSNSLDMLKNISDDNTVLEYDKNGFYLETGTNSKTKYEFDTNLNVTSANIFSGFTTLDLKFYNSNDNFKEVTREEFLQYLSKSSPVIPVSLQMDCYTPVEDDIKMYGYATFDYNNSAQKFLIKDKYNMDEIPADDDLLIDFANTTAYNLTPASDIEKYYISNDSCAYSFSTSSFNYGEPSLATFNRDGYIRRLESGGYLFEYKYEIGEGLLEKDISFEEFLSYVISDNEPTYIEIDGRNPSMLFNGTFCKIKGIDEYVVYDGEEDINTMPEFEAIIKGGYGILNYITNISKLEDVRFTKDLEGYHAHFDDDNYHYDMVFNKLGYLINIARTTKESNFTYDFKVLATNEEYGKVELVDEVFGGNQHYYAPVLAKIKPISNSKGKIDDNGDAKWYTSIGVYNPDEDLQEYIIVRPGVNTYKVAYKEEDAFVLNIYSNLDTENKQGDAIFKSGEKIFKDNGDPLFKTPDNITGYTFAGYYSNKECTIELNKDAVYTSNVNIYFKYNPLTYANYSITGNASTDYDSFDSIETTDLKPTNLGCIYVKGEIEVETSGSSKYTLMYKETIIQFDVLKNAEVDFIYNNNHVNSTNPVEIFQITTEENIPYQDFEAGKIYVLKNGNFVKLDRYEYADQYYRKVSTQDSGGRETTGYLNAGTVYIQINEGLLEFNNLYISY
ncbi:MAG: hypothetical protein K6F81_00580 [Acholeplasmatales bacterium]|nr:hypothetical protein [Acholeplasmatales bacterium]